MKYILKNQRNNLFCFCVALCIIIMMNPYFVWTTFSNIIKVIANMFVIIVVTYEYCHIMVIQRINKKQLILTLMLLGYLFYRTINSQEFEIIYQLKVSFVIFQLIAFVLLKEEERTKTFDYFKKIFAFFIAFGLLTYPLAMLNIHFAGLGAPLQSESIAWSEGKFYYKNYYLAIYTASNDLSLGYNSRFCGVFNEPGIIGTFSALFLTADRYDLRKGENIALLIGGLLSFSFAFYVLTALYFLFSGEFLSVVKSQKGMLRFLILCLLGLIIAIMVLNSNVLYNKVNELLISRLRSFMTGHDNRTTEAFDLLYKSFKESGSMFDHIFGKGFGTTIKDFNASNTSSYKTQIYELGYFGLLFLYSLCTYALVAINSFLRKKSKFILLTLFLISTYQRIGILDIAYFSILLCGGSDLWIKDTKMKKQNILILE